MPSFDESNEKISWPRIGWVINNGQTTKRIFANFAGLGFDAEVVKTTTKKYKNLGGKTCLFDGIIEHFRDI